MLRASQRGKRARKKTERERRPLLPSLESRGWKRTTNSLNPCSLLLFRVSSKWCLENNKLSLAFFKKRESFKSLLQINALLLSHFALSLNIDNGEIYGSFSWLNYHFTTSNRQSTLETIRSITGVLLIILSTDDTQFTLTQLATQVIEISVTISNIPQGNTRHRLLLKREFGPFFNMTSWLWFRLLPGAWKQKVCLPANLWKTLNWFYVDALRSR